MAGERFFDLPDIDIDASSDEVNRGTLVDLSQECWDYYEKQTFHFQEARVVVQYAWFSNLRSYAQYKILKLLFDNPTDHWDPASIYAIV
eukprot:scaffold3816_cov128-Skeletonema_dohrnii-CCMP3373.AAC.1